MRDFMVLNDIDNSTIMSLINKAIKYKQSNTAPYLNGKFISNIFLENSTRTKLSFEVAERRAGMQVINFEPKNSSIEKGETLYDTAKTLEAIGMSALVIRHFEDNFYNEFIGRLNIPIINAGDGKGNHPSQSLLDLMTIYEEFGCFEGIKIVILGDILHSRVANSNADIMSRLGMQVCFASPEYWQVKGYDFVNIDDAVCDADVVMLLRIQNERHLKVYDKGNYLIKYGLSMDRYKRMKPGSIIMHPSPFNRGVEIDDALIEINNSRIFRQMYNGVYARLAILDYVLGEGA
jgi:aspartate carbamoyltransferase catalytic subunit